MLKGLFGLGRRSAPLTAHVPAAPASPIGAEPPPVAPRAAPAPTLTRPVAAVPGREPGELLGGVYPVLRRLGEGGFGEVFLCRHPAWNIEVAVKLPHADTLADPRTLPELEHEAEEWTGLGLHPNITYCYHLHPVGTPPMPLLVVEYVAGGTLRQRIEGSEAVADLRGNLDLAIQLCHALEHAHGRGLVHRDLKPENVLLAADGTVKLTDFGIARRGAVGGAAGTSGGVVQSSAIGTEGYMAPEQMIPGAEIDARTDLYALGACLYELFCFALPYSGRAAEGRTPLSPAALRRDRALPEGLGALLPRLVSWEVAGRPASARAVREELAAIYRASHGEASRYAELPELSLTASGHNNRGVSYHFLGKLEQAEAAFRDALAADPLHPEATFNLGLMEWRAAKITDATLVQLLKEVGRRDAEDWRKDWLLSQIHIERGDAQAAITALELASPHAMENRRLLAALDNLKAQPAPWGNRLETFNNTNKYSVWAVAISSDSHWVLSGTGSESERADNDVQLWDLSSPNVPRVLKGHHRAVTSVAFYGGDKFALSGSVDGSVRAWDLSSGRCLYTLDGHGWDRSIRHRDAFHSEAVQAVAISPNEVWALSGSRDKSLILWDLTERVLVRVFEGHSDCVNSVAISPDGLFGLSGSSDRTVRVWDLVSGACILQLEGHADRVSSVVVSPDGRRGLSGGDDKTLRLWDLDTGECLQVFEGHLDKITSVAISPDGRCAVSGSFDKTLRLWDLAIGRCLRTYDAHEEVWAVTFCRNGRHGLSGGFRGTFNFWEFASGSPVPFELARHQTATDLAEDSSRFSETLGNAREALASGDPATACHIVDEARQIHGYARSREALDLRSRASVFGVRTGLLSAWCSQIFEGHGDGVSAVAIRDEHQGVSGSWDNTLRVWDFSAGRCTRVLEGHTAAVRSVAISRNGDFCLSGSSDNTLRLWDLATGACQRIFEGHSDGVFSVAISRDGRVGFSGSHDKTLRMWDLGSGRCLRAFEGHKESVWSVAISDDGRWGASAGDAVIFQDLTLEDSPVRLWDLRDGRCVRELRVTPGPISPGTFLQAGRTSIVFSRDDQRCVAGGYDGSLLIWELNAGACREIGVHEGATNSVAISPDGRWVISGGDDGTVRVSDLDLERVLYSLRGHAGAVQSVTFSADSRYCLSGGRDGTVQLWEFEWDLEFPPSRFGIQRLAVDAP
jgi:WD40 repeat protein/serine/threonine protein kinase